MAAAQKQNNKLNYKTNEILIQADNSFRAEQIENQFAVVELKVDRKISKSLNAWKLSFTPQKIHIDELIQKLQAHSSIQIAQVNHKVQKRQTFPNDNVPWQFHNTNGTDADVDAPVSYTHLTLPTICSV